MKTTFVFIGGGSGSGKTTLSTLLDARLIEQGKTCATIKMDDYFHEKPERIDLKKYQDETIFDTPEMLYLDELRQHLLDLHKGQSIAKPIFNFATSRRNGTDVIPSSDVIIVEGIFALEFAKKWLLSDEIFTLTVNVETSSYLEIVKRRVQRNIRDYQQNKDWVIQQERMSVGPGFFKYTAAGALDVDISLLNDSATQSNGTVGLDALNTTVGTIIIQLNQIIGSLIPLARKLSPDVKQVVINSHAGDNPVDFIFRQ